MNKLLVIVGTLLSLTYLILVAWVRWPISLEMLRALPLNNFGDALAGIVGPLALLWLILGFLQQGEELKQNTEALRLQAEELKASVEQQKAMVESSREQFAFQQDNYREERNRLVDANRPRFTLELPREAGMVGGVADGAKLWSFGARLRASAVHNLRAASNFSGWVTSNWPTSRIDEFHVATFGADQGVWFHIPEKSVAQVSPSYLQIILTYETETGLEIRQFFRISFSDKVFRITENRVIAESDLEMPEDG